MPTDNQPTPGTPAPAAAQARQAAAESHDPREEDDAPPPPAKPGIPAPAPQSAPKPSGVLARAARAAGFSDEEIAESSPEDLRAALAVASALAGRPQAPPAAPPPAQPAAPEIDLGIDESEYDPKLVAALKKVASGSAAELAGVKKQLADREERDRQREVQQQVAAIDAGFDALADGYAAQLGQGTAQELIGGDRAAYERRVAVVRSAGITDADTPRAVAAKLKKAAETLFGKPAKKDADPAQSAEAPDAASRWQAAHLAAPTSREAKEKPGEAKAKKTVARLIKDYEAANGDGAGGENPDDFVP